MKIDLIVSSPKGEVTTVLNFANETSALEFLARNAFKGDVHACVHVNVLHNVRFPSGLVEALRSHYRNNKIECIKLVREMTGASVCDAKDFVDENIF